jgi:hypothetical protein
MRKWLLPPRSGRVWSLAMAVDTVFRSFLMDWPIIGIEAVHVKPPVIWL